MKNCPTTFSENLNENYPSDENNTILLKTLAYVRDIDGLTSYFDFQCFTSPLLIGDENQFWARITKPPPAEITKRQPGYGFPEEC